MDLKINTIINSDQTNLQFAKTIEEIVTICLFFDSFKDELVNLRVLSRSVMKKENSILHFGWLDETVYDQWKCEHAMALEKIQMAAHNKEMNWFDEEQPQGEKIQIEAI